MANRFDIKNNGRRSAPASFKRLASLCLLLLIMSFITLIEARDKGGDDIILAKGKIIMRGGKGKGNIILDHGSGESGGGGHEGHDGHHMMAPMMQMMGHFNPYQYYPMHQHQPQMVIHPVYIEDHSALNHHHQHHEPEQQQHHHHQEYHHEEPQHYQHHEMGHHYEPQQEMHHEQHHEEHQQHNHHEPMGHHQQYEHEEEGHHGGGGGSAGYETHPMLSMLMHGGSGLQPVAYNPQGMAAMQALQQPPVYLQHPSLDQQQQQVAYQQMMAAAAQEEALARQQKQQQEQLQQEQQTKDASSQSATTTSTTSTATSTRVNPVTSLLEKSANNPLVQIIKPLFKRNKDPNTSASKANKP